MKTFLLAVGTSLLAAAAFGQSTAPVPASPATTKGVVDEAARILNGAKADGQAETSRLATEQAMGNRAEQIAATTDPVPGTDAQKLVESVEKRLQPVLDGVEPQGRILIAQSATAPAMRAPDPDAVAAPKVVVPATGDISGTAPPVPKAAPGTKNAVVGSRIEITSQGDVYLDTNQSIAVFTDEVVVDHPQFHMTCDELQVYMLKDEDKKDAKAAATPGAGPPVEEENKDGKIKEAIGKGRKVVIHKLDEHGENQVGVCRHATYIGESGDVVMRVMPQVQRGTNVIIATDPATFMVIKQNGELKVHGPARTEIISKEEKPKPKPEPAPVVPKAAPVTPPAKTKATKTISQ